MTVLHTCSYIKVPVIRVRFKNNSIFLEIFSKNTLVLNIMKIVLVEAELFHADGQTDMHQ